LSYFSFININVWLTVMKFPFFSSLSNFLSFFFYCSYVLQCVPLSFKKN
jgi:hypothetical protein